MSVFSISREAQVSEIVAEMDRRGAIIETMEKERDALLAAVRFADTRAVSRAAYSHACMEDRKLRDLIDAALGRQVPQ